MIVRGTGTRVARTGGTQKTSKSEAELMRKPAARRVPGLIGTWRSGQQSGCAGS